MSLSIALNTNQQATGFVLLEEGPLSLNMVEAYQVNVLSSSISFAKSNAGSCPTANMTQIEKIVITFLSKPVNASCAMLKDMKTVVSLYTSTYFLETRQQVTIQPKFIPDPGAPTEIRINDLAFIVFGIAAPGQESTLCSTAASKQTLY